jgi:hypothetical protein
MDLSNALWRKSSHSGNTGGNCVELARLADTVGIRDSKNVTFPYLTVSRSTMAKLMDRIKAAEFDR